MKKLDVGFLSGISSGMITAVLVTIVLSVFCTLKLQSGRELPHDFNRLDKDISESQGLISNLVTAPVLAPLKDSWREVSSTLELAGLELIPVDSSAGSVGSTYEGPVKHWSGSVSGDAKLVLALIKKIQQTDPVFLLDYSKVDGEFKLYLAVVGI